MFINNNRASFHFWRKENFVKHQKFSKYYENDCLQNLILLFMSLLTAKFVESSHIFLKNVLKKIEILFNIKFQTQWKGRKSCFHIRQILVFFCSLIPLILDENSMKGLRVTKIV